MTTPANLSRDQALSVLTAAGQPYELVPVEVAGRTVKAFRNAPQSLRVLFEQAASDATFLVYEGERLSFAQALAAARCIAHGLATRYGVVRGDRVAISMRNYPEWVLAFMAVTSMGAIAVAMNALWQPEELDYGLKDSGAKVLFADQERLVRLAQCSSSLAVGVVAVRSSRADCDRLFAGRNAVVLLDELMAASLASPSAPISPAANWPGPDVSPDDAATIFYTSGSTGHPKGVLTSHRSIISALLSWELDATAGALMTGITPPVSPHQPATLLGVPLFHVTGSHAVFLACFRIQRKLVCMYKWDAALAAELIEREKISSFIAPSAMTGDMVREARRTERDLSTLMVIGGGGAPRPPEQVRQIDEVFSNAMPGTGWGMSETNAIGTGIGGPEYLTRPASSGRCAAVLELKVVNEQGQTLPAGQRGELLVRGTSLFMGYWNRPELNATLFDDGWFRTGDVAYLDDEGYLFIVDRIKDLIIRGGENIGCGQVEAALVKHPKVLEAAVYAVPDERLGEEVGATVHAEPGVDIQELQGFLGKHLARFEVPRYIRISENPLPRTASGKILKRQLRDEALAALNAEAGKDRSAS